jgi:F-type H+-transporting ATPase subunit a
MQQNSAINPVASKGCLYLLVVLVVAAIFCGVFPQWFLPKVLGTGIAVPVITIYGEPLAKGELTIGNWDVTNTAIALVITDILVIAIALSLRNLKMVPSGFQNFFEVIVEYLYNLAKQIVGSDAKKVFPLIATFFLMVLVANWFKLLPGVESVGFLHCAEEGFPAYPVHAEAPIEGGIVALKVEEGMYSGEKATEESYKACEYKYFEHEEYAEEYDKYSKEDPEIADRLAVTPFLRGATTDLNLTLALAVIAMVAVQFFGVQKLGLGYFTKFVNLPAIGNAGKKPMGVMDFVVGLLEILSELSKVISFAFRLFGVIFAGGILLIVATFLTGGLLPSAVYGLEFFIGAIQAFVFFILPLVLINLAMTSHHGGEEHDDHH